MKINILLEITLELINPQQNYRQIAVLLDIINRLTP